MEAVLLIMTPLVGLIIVSDVTEIDLHLRSVPGQLLADRPIILRFIILWEITISLLISRRRVILFGGLVPASDRRLRLGVLQIGL